MAPSPETVQELCQVAKLPNVHGYQSYRGDAALRTAIAQWYKQIYKVDVNADTEVLPLAGSKEGIMHLTMAFVNAGDEVLVPNPGYPTYEAVSHLAGANVRFYSLKEENDWQIDFEELDRQDLSRVKLMWVNYPNMPTGATTTDETYTRLIALARKHRFLVCFDNPYSQVLNTTYRSILAFEGAREVAVELSSLSKSHNMAGWRIGWVAGASDYLDTVLKFKSNMDSGIFLALQRAAVVALRNPLSWHEQRNKEYAERRQLVEAIATRLGCTFDPKQVGMFLWAKLPDSIESAESFSDHLLQQARVFITPGTVFGSNGSRYIRISLCVSQSLMSEAIERIGKLSLADNR